jgi:hypothetical protein
MKKNKFFLSSLDTKTMSAGMDIQPLSCQFSDIPATLESSKRQKPIPLTIQTAYLSTQSGTQSAGGSMIFQLNSSNGYIKPGSLYLKARITVVGSGANATGDTALAFGNACRNASSVIDRFTVSCSTMLESINYYGSSYIPTLLLHASNQTYVQSDDAILEGGKRNVAGLLTGAAAALSNRLLDVATGAVCANQVIDVAIPLYSNLFNNEIGYPLALLQQNTIIQLDFATMGRAFYASVAGSYTDFQVSNAFLVYDLIQPSSEFIMMEKQKLAMGQMFQLPFVSVMSSAYQKGGNSSTINWGVGLSSLLGLTYSCQVAPGTITDPKYLLADNTLSVATGGNMNTGGQANFRLFLDSVQKNAVIQDTVGVAYAEMQKVFGILSDVSRTSANGGSLAYNTASDFGTTANSYVNQYFVGGQNCTKVNEAMALTGSAVNNVQFIVDTGATACSVINALAWHQRILTIGADGSASVLL